MIFYNLVLKTTFHFTKSFSSRNVVRAPGKYLWQGLIKTPRYSFFLLSPSFQNLGLKVVPPAERGRGRGWYCEGDCDLIEQCDYWLLQGKYLWQGLFKTPRYSFFVLSPAFQNLGLKVVPPAERGRGRSWYCEGDCDLIEQCDYWLLQVFHSSQCKSVFRTLSNIYSEFFDRCLSGS